MPVALGGPLGLDFEANLVPTWRHFGVEVGPTSLQVASKIGPDIIQKNYNFFDRFLIDFLPILAPTWGPMSCLRSRVALLFWLLGAKRLHNRISIDF